MKIRMQLLSDTIFGNGASIPGEEDISVLRDERGFPYYKGGTLKGIFREELIQYLLWNDKSEEELQAVQKQLLGIGGSSFSAEDRKMVFSDFQLSQNVRDVVFAQCKSKKNVLEALTHIRVFTRLDQNGIADDGSLRMARCVNKGLIFYGEISCQAADKEIVKSVLSQIKGIGSLRNRGFGKVKLSVVEG